MLEALRALFRKPAPLATRSYDSAASGRRWRDAGETALTQASMLADRWTLQRRARYLIANNALAASGLEAWISALVGTGIVPQSAHPDKGVRDGLNGRFQEWWEDCDADGATDFGDHKAHDLRWRCVCGQNDGRRRPLQTAFD
jgi:capsid protein